MRRLRPGTCRSSCPGRRSWRPTIRCCGALSEPQQYLSSCMLLLHILGHGDFVAAPYWGIHTAHLPGRCQPHQRTGLEVEALTYHARWLTVCRYRAALDAALATEQVELVANLLEELAARSGLGAALGAPSHKPQCLTSSQAVSDCINAQCPAEHTGRSQVFMQIQRSPTR